MKREFCLDIEGDSYAIGDLNLFLDNKENIQYPPIDPMHPKHPFFTGMIRQNVQIDQETRTFLLYIPENFPISGAGIFLFLENGMDAEAFLKQSCWKKIAEENRTALILLESKAGGWDRRNIQSEVDYSEKVFRKAISRVYFSLNEATYYIIGLGDGAYVATAYALLNSALFAAMAMDGDYQLHPALLAQLGQIRSDRDAALSKLDVAIPAWLIRADAEEGGAILDGLKRACCTVDRGLHNDYADVFQQNMKQYMVSLDGLPMAEVWFTGKTLREKMSPETRSRAMADFVLHFKRWLGIGNGDLRPARTEEDMKLKKQSKEIDGRMREWLIYEPSAYRNQPDRKLPVVLAIHGYSCTGELFAENTQWHVIGEKRGFLVVYVSAYPSNGISGGHTVPLPAWNALSIHTETDDVKYIKTVLQEVKAAYPVDEERIYVSGHSNGSLLTNLLMEEMPLSFAAFAPQGAPYHLDVQNDASARKRRIKPDGILRPVWLMMGHEDIGDQDSLKPDSINTLFLNMMCEVNGLERTQNSYLENGKYCTVTFSDQAHVPLLRFTGVQDLPHTYTPEMAQMFWDQFFCHFRRKADGSIQYTE